jgi:hypothetical protein
MNFTVSAQKGVRGCVVVGGNYVVIEILTHWDITFFTQNNPLNIHLKL